jgi:hypothetical protein
MLESLEQKLNKKSSQKMVRVAFGFFIFLASLPSLGADYLGDQEKSNLINSHTKELNLSLLAQMQTTANQHTVKIENFVAYNNLPQYDNGGRAGLKILGQAAKAIFNNQQTNSPAQQLVKKAPSVVKATKNPTLNFSVNMSSSGARAEMDYSTSLKAVVLYDTSSSGMKIEVSHPLGGNKSLAFTHGNGTYGGTEDKVGVRWGF